ncbi:MAG TPA: ROK family protein [Phycisphaerae bacterium]|nr:ROK family protein [Phycisphaerae bacterium]
MTKRYVGVDLGGTNLKLGLVSADGKIVHRSSAATEAERGPDHVLARIAHAVRRLAEGAHLPLTDIAAVGVGAPGPLDSKAGIVVFAPNMAGWRDVPVRDRLQGDLGRPVVLENDANVAAYGEFRCGAARNVSNLALLTLGTGIGGGIVLDGRLFRGSTDTGAELGHMVIQYGGRPCGCGNRGCLEAYASATAVVARAREALRAGDPGAPGLADSADLTCKDIFAAAGDGDALARRIVEETADYLAAGITNILHVLNPEMVVLTGGMMGAGEAFLERIRRRVRQSAFERASRGCPIVWSTLGGDAGILGAALAAEALDRTGQPA